jgi:hypothetical protein
VLQTFPDRVRGRRAQAVFNVANIYRVYRLFIEVMSSSAFFVHFLFEICTSEECLKDIDKGGGAAYMKSQLNWYHHRHLNH